MANTRAFFNAITNKTSADFTDAEFQKDYVKYFIVMNLSYHLDLVMIANTINTRYNISNENHYLFLKNIVKKRRRNLIWVNRNKDDNQQIISDYYNVSNEKASEYLKILTDDQIEDIKSRMNKGGKDVG